MPLVVPNAPKPTANDQSRQYWKLRNGSEEVKPGHSITVIVIACLAIFVGGIIYVPKQIENSVNDAVINTLSRLGLGGLAVKTDGQDVYISGHLPVDRLSSEIPKLHAIARGVTCDVALLGDVVCPANIFVSIEEQAASKVSQVRTPVQPQNDLGQALDSQPSIDANSEAHADYHNFLIEKQKDLITINGEMPDPRVRDLMLRRGTKLGLAVIDDMEVTGRKTSDYFAWAVERAWMVLQYLESGQTKWVDGKFSVDGKITSDQAELAEKAYKSDFFSPQLAGINLDVRPVYNDVETCNQAFADVLANGNIEFSPEGAKILSSSHVLLDRIAVLAEQCTLSFMVGNHTGDSGNSARDMALSQQRAEAVVIALTDRGIKGQRLTAKGFGGTKPLKNNNTPIARMQNRRTNIVAKQ